MLGRNAIQSGAIIGKDRSCIKARSGVNWCPQYRNVYNAFSTKPSWTIANLQNTMLKTIVDSGAWSVLDWFVCLAGETEVESRLDWKSLTKTCVNAGNGNVWTSLKGIKGSGAGYLKSGFVPSVDGVHIGPHNCTYGFCSNLDIASADQVELGARYDTINNTVLYSRYTDGKALAKAHIITDSYIGNNVSDRKGVYMIVKPATNVSRYYKNNNLLGEAIVSFLHYVPNREIALLAIGDGGLNYSLNQLSFAFAGGALTIAQISAVTNAINLYNDSISYFFDR